jgi:hypothetical protein
MRILLIVLIISFTTSCQKIAKEIKQITAFKGTPTYKTTKQDFIREVAATTTLPKDAVTSSYSFTNDTNGKKYSFLITLSPVSKELFNDSIVGLLSDDIHKTMRKQITNLNAYDDVIVTWRNEVLKKGVSKRVEFIIVIPQNKLVSDLAP